MSQYLPIVVSFLALVVSVLAWRAPRTPTKWDDRALEMLEKLLSALEKK